MGDRNDQKAKSRSMTAVVSIVLTTAVYLFRVPVFELSIFGEVYEYISIK